MQKRGILHNKRGMSEVLLAITGIVLVAIAIIAMTIVGMKFLGLIQKSVSPEEQATIISFNALGDEIKALANDPASFAATPPDKPFDYYIGNDFVLVGFDRDIPTPNLCYGLLKLEGRTISKPAECSGIACLCLYKTGSFENPYKTCIKLPTIYLINSINLLNPAYKSSYPNSVLANFRGAVDILNKEYTHLIIYGKCDFPPSKLNIATSEDYRFKSQQLYLEKKGTGLINIFIVANSDLTKQRYKLYASKYSPTYVAKMIEEKKNSPLDLIQLSTTTSVDLSSLPNDAILSLAKVYLNTSIQNRSYDQKEKAVEIAIYNLVIQRYPNTSQAKDALYNLILIYSFLNNDYPKVVETGEEYIKKYPDDSRKERICSMLNAAYTATGSEKKCI